MNVSKALDKEAYDQHGKLEVDLKLLYSLITSVSIVSRSLNACCGRITGGGASIEVFFDDGLSVFLDAEKNDPKKLDSLSLGSTSRSLLLLTWRRLVSPAEGCCGLLPLMRSVTIAVA
jgi:hypothetical protein